MPLAIYILLLIDSTCFGHYYAHNQEYATMMLNYHPNRTAPNHQHTANQERNGQCGNSKNIVAYS